jgi:hypothetical protein
VTENQKPIGQWVFFWDRDPVVRSRCTYDNSVEDWGLCTVLAARQFVTKKIQEASLAIMSQGPKTPKVPKVIAVIAQ